MIRKPSYSDLEQKIRVLEESIKGKRTKKAPKERDNRLKTVSSHIPGMIYQFMKKLDGTYCVPFTTDAIQNIFGCSPQDVRDDFAPIAMVILPEDLDNVIQSMESSAVHMTTWQCEYRVQVPGQPIRWLLGRATPEKSADGSIIWNGFNTDITDCKLTADALRDREEKYRLVIENAEDVIVIAQDGMLKYFNPVTVRTLGYSEKELLSKPFSDFVHPDDREKLMAAHLKMMRGEEALPVRQFKVLCKNGFVKWADSNTSVISWNEKPATLNLIRDITERKKAEGALLDKCFTKLRAALGATVQTIAVAVETRDPYIAGHQRRVADLTRAIAMEMNLSSDQIEGIRMAAVIHDLGKISVPAEILNKPTKMTDMELSFIKTHAQSGYEILKNIDFPWPVARMVLEHHERMNGSGYPKGLRGDQILLESRILSVADVLEAMASRRSYRPGLSVDAALKEIEKNREMLYDADVVNACLSLFRERGFQIPSDVNTDAMCG